MWKISSGELERYAEDWCRLPPYTYSDAFFLWPADLSTQRQCAGRHGRVALASEREVLMGLLPGHTRRSHKGIKGCLRGLDAYEEDTIRCALIGNSIHTGVGCEGGNAAHPHYESQKV